MLSLVDDIKDSRRSAGPAKWVGRYESLLCATIGRGWEARWYWVKSKKHAGRIISVRQEQRWARLTVPKRRWILRTFPICKSSVKSGPVYFDDKYRGYLDNLFKAMSENPVGYMCIIWSLYWKRSIFNSEEASNQRVILPSHVVSPSTFSLISGRFYLQSPQIDVLCLSATSHTHWDVQVCAFSVLTIFVAHAKHHRLGANTRRDHPGHTTNVSDFSTI